MDNKEEIKKLKAEVKVLARKKVNLLSDIKLIKRDVVNKSAMVDSHMKQVKDWSTPKTPTGGRESRASKKRRGAGGIDLQTQALLFPTPSISAAIQGQNEPDGKRGQTLLGAARGQDWPTPTVPGPHQVGKIEEWGGSHNKLRDGRPGPVKSSTNGKSRGQLNPAWVEQLMGIPVGWTNFDYWATW